MPFRIPATEEDGERDGFLSHQREYHAITIGIAVGFASMSPVPKTREFVYTVVGLTDEEGEMEPRTKAMLEAKAESWYAAGGFIIGVLLAVAIGMLAVFGLINAPEAFDAEIARLAEQASELAE